MFSFQVLDVEKNYCIIIIILFIFVCTYKKDKNKQRGVSNIQKDLYYEFLFTFHSRNHYDFPISIHN